MAWPGSARLLLSLSTFPVRHIDIEFGVALCLSSLWRGGGTGCRARRRSSSGACLGSTRSPSCSRRLECKSRDSQSGAPVKMWKICPTFVKFLSIFCPCPSFVKCLDNCPFNVQMFSHVCPIFWLVLVVLSKVLNISQELNKQISKFRPMSVYKWNLTDALRQCPIFVQLFLYVVS